MSASRQSTDAKALPSNTKNQSSLGTILASLGTLVAEEEERLGSWLNWHQARGTPRPAVLGEGTLAGAPLTSLDSGQSETRSCYTPTAIAPLPRVSAYPPPSSNHHNQELRQHLIYINRPCSPARSQSPRTVCFFPFCFSSSFVSAHSPQSSRVSFRGVHLRLKLTDSSSIRTCHCSISCFGLARRIRPIQLGFFLGAKGLGILTPAEPRINFLAKGARGNSSSDASNYPATTGPRDVTPVSVSWHSSRPPSNSGKKKSC